MKKAPFATSEDFPPSYTYKKKSDLKKTVDELTSRLSPCSVCPMRCGINRYHEKTGKCGTRFLPKVASHSIHHGEEPPISGQRGSGTIFFSGCPMECSFCQNYPISQLVNGNEVSTDELSNYMVRLQKRGAHNINLVTPTHFVPQIVEALVLAIKNGLNIPIVYNSSGYDEVETIALLDGIVDIYLPDMKYGENEAALRYSGARNYVETNQAVIREMYRQVGDLTVDSYGIAKRGLIIRHLVLPRNISNTEGVLEFISGLSRSITVSLMSQYFPAHRAVALPELSCKLSRREYEEASLLLEGHGLENGWIQPLS
jgi:putative pyruvate formate lyase activating enzyme